MIPTALSFIRPITLLKQLSLAAASLSVALATTAPAAEPPTDLNTADLGRRTIERRALEAAIWGMPAVNYDLMLQEMLNKTAGKVNQMIYWGRPLDWKNQTLTPNPDTLYFMSFLNTGDVGPIVIEVPAAGPEGSLNANIVNVWQQPLEDAGLLGVDKGKGVKLLMLPPGYTGEVPAGYEALQPETHGSYVLFRSNLASHGDADIAKSVAYGKQIKIYPLSQAANPPALVFTDVKDILFDSTIRYDDSFFLHLDRIVQAEPWLNRDRAMIDQLRSIGIEKGKPFAPDAATRQALAAGVREAHTWLAAKYDAGLPPFFAGTHWTFPAHPELLKAAAENFENPDNYPVDWRGVTYHYAYIGIKRLGAGQFYLINIKDKDGESYDGAKTYRLNVPANVPTEQYWSLTAYDRDTHALIKNVSRASRASNSTDVKKNADGSVDLYLGPDAPAGQATNWIPTDPARKFELMFRLYGPKKAFFDKVWRLPDVEKVTAPMHAFRGGYPTAQGAQRAQDEQDLQRAVQSYRFFYPTVSMEGVFQGTRNAGVTDNRQAMILSGAPRHVLFTGNSDTPYMGATFNLQETGPLVIELPPGPYLGIVNDHNFGWVQDIGLPGPDAGNGGKHLILPPGYKGEAPREYFTARSKTNYILVGARALPPNGDMQAGLDAQRKVKIYPLSQAANPPAYEFVDRSNDKINITLLPWEDNIQFWQKLHKVLQQEPAVEEFRPMYGMLAMLGIEQGKPFAPDARMGAILERAAKAGRDQMLVAGYASTRGDRFVWPDRKWEYAALRYENGDFELPTGIDLEARDRWFSQAVGMSPKMVLRAAGAGSLYWFGLRDKDGSYLDGAKTYRLSVPQPVPQKLFWSITVYDAETRSQIATDQDQAALRSLVELKDVPQTGTTDLYFGPNAPPGHERRWIKTIPGKGWFVYLRLYGPDGPAFDGRWRPGDFEESAPSGSGGRALQ